MTINTSRDRARKQRRSMPVIAWLCLTCALSGCAVDAPVPRRGDRVAGACPPVEAADYYYPVGTIVANNRDDSDSFWREHFTRFMRAAKVDSLSCGQVRETYRLLWLPTNGPALIAELAKREGGWRVRRVVFNDPRETSNGSSLNRLVVNQSADSDITNDAAGSFLAEFQSSFFWTASLPATASTREDGHRWIVESQKDGSYRVITVRSGDREQIETAARALVRLAGMQLSEGMSPD